MDDLTEKVARAIRRDAFARTGRVSSFDEGLPLTDAELSAGQSAIRAVLDGIREPTPAMIERAQRSTEMGGYVAAEWANAYDCFREFHYAMIDELRKLYD